MNRINGFEIYSQLFEKFWCITDTGNVSVTWCISFARWLFGLNTMIHLTLKEGRKHCKIYQIILNFQILGNICFGWS